LYFSLLFIGLASFPLTGAKPVSGLFASRP